MSIDSTRCFRRLAMTVTAAALLPLALTACSGDDSKDTASSSARSSAGSPSASRPMDNATAAGTDEPFGAGCASVPKSGAGSFDGMSQDPVATAPPTTRPCPRWSPP